MDDELQRESVLAVCVTNDAVWCSVLQCVAVCNAVCVTNDAAYDYC